jgi:hypothetical protein
MYCTGLKELVRDQHSSLFRATVVDEEEKVLCHWQQDRQIALETKTFQQ